MNLGNKAQGISMTFIVIAALTLIVLIVIVLFFTGGTEKLIGQSSQTIEGATPDQKAIWIKQCELSCRLEKNPSGNCISFCEKKFPHEEITYSCTGAVPDTKSLSVDCGSGITTQTTDSVKLASLTIGQKGDRCDC